MRVNWPQKQDAQEEYQELFEMEMGDLLSDWGSPQRSEEIEDLKKELRKKGKIFPFGREVLSNGQKVLVFFLSGKTLKAREGKLILGKNLGLSLPLEKNDKSFSVDKGNENVFRQALQAVPDDVIPVVVASKGFRTKDIQEIVKYAQICSFNPKTSLDERTGTFEIFVALMMAGVFDCYIQQNQNPLLGLNFMDWNKYFGKSKGKIFTKRMVLDVYGLLFPKSILAERSIDDQKVRKLFSKMKYDRMKEAFDKWAKKRNLTKTQKKKK